jgi:hypothetical protein
MSQGFKMKFNEMRESDPTQNSVSSNDSEKFSSPGHVRNLCFVWPDGKMMFLNYAYLVSGTYLPEDGIITLVFTSDTVIIKGSGLQNLYSDLFSHITRQIICINPRYIQTASINETIVNEILVIGNS